MTTLQGITGKIGHARMCGDDAIGTDAPPPDSDTAHGEAAGAELDVVLCTNEGLTVNPSEMSTLPRSLL